MVLGLESRVIHPIWWTNRERNKWFTYMLTGRFTEILPNQIKMCPLTDIVYSVVMWVGHLQNKLLNVGNNQPTSKQTEKCYVCQGCKINIPFIKSWNNVGWKKAKLLQVCQNNGTVHV